jgi:phage protein D
MTMASPIEAGAITPTVKVGMMELSQTLKRALIRTLIDTNLHRPDMFELTFLDSGADLLDHSGLDIGSEVTLSVGGMAATTTLMIGEVTSIEGDYDNLMMHTVVRGYEHAHRLQKARRSRTFLDSTDADIARRVATEAGLKIGDINDPGVTHRYVAQVAQTDWEFLKGRAGEIGYDVRVVAGKFTFAPAHGMSGPSLAAGSSALLGANTLTFGRNLTSFRPRVASSGLVKEAEVRVWDPTTVSVVTSTKSVKSETADIVDDAGSLGRAHRTLAVPPVPSPSKFAPASSEAYAVIDRPLAWGSVAQSSTDAMAAGMAEQTGSTFAEAEGSAIAADGVTAGATITIDGVPSRFAGKWFVTAALHTFEVSEGYHVRFEVSGRHDRSLHGLVTAGHSNRRQRGLIDGLVPGIVTNNLDEDGMYRVKVALPWLGPDFETDWARVVMPGLGTTYGFMAMPEVDDEVLVGFEFGDVRRAYVLGGVANGNTEIDLGGDVVQQGTPGGHVVKRGIVSRLGNKVLIDDDGDGRTPPAASGITLGTVDDKITVHLDDVAKKVTILCESSSPPASIEIKQSGPGGSITIEQAGSGGTLDIKSAGNITVDAAAPGTLTLSGGAGVKIDGGAGMVELSGSTVKLN